MSTESVPRSKPTSRVSFIRSDATGRQLDAFDLSLSTVGTILLILAFVVIFFSTVSLFAATGGNISGEVLF
jgi:hypothetical protein